MPSHLDSGSGVTQPWGIIRGTAFPARHHGDGLGQGRSSWGKGGGASRKRGRLLGVLVQEGGAGRVGVPACLPACAALTYEYKIITIIIPVIILFIRLYYYYYYAVKLLYIHLP